MRLLLLFLLITLLTSIDASNIRKLRNALNAASDRELELLEMDVDMNGDMEMDMDMDMDADLDEELDLEDPPPGISNANNQGGGNPMSNVPQSTPNPGIIDSIKQKGSNIWKKGKGLFGKGENKGTGAPGKEGDKQGIIKKWKLKLKKGGASTKAKFCRKFQKRPPHCPPCPIHPRKAKPQSNTPGSNVVVTSPPSQLVPAPVLFESEISMDISGFPNFITKFCGSPSCDCPKPRPRIPFFKKLKLRKKNKPTQPDTIQGPPPPAPVNNAQPSASVDNAQAPQAPA